MGLDEVSEAIGSLRTSVQNLTSQWAQQDARASEGRRQLYDKVDAMRLELTRLTSRVDTISGEIKEIKPSIDRADEEHHQGIGSKKTLALIWGGLIAFFAATSAVIVEVVHDIWTKH